MEPWEQEFIEEVYEYVNEEVLPTLHSSARYYRECRARPDSRNSRVTIRRLSHYRRNSNQNIERVNSTLQNSMVELDFQYGSGDGGWDSWTNLLTQFTARLSVPGVTVPAALKWESQGDSGRLKADEWYGSSEPTYLFEEVGAERAIHEAVCHHCHEVVPCHTEALTTEQVSPAAIVNLYEDAHELLAELVAND